MTKYNSYLSKIDMSSTDQVVQAQGDRLVGQVKWFNNKAGYGFITVSDGEHSGKDIFVHYTTVRVTNSQYKYLIQGEYVEFTLTKSTSGEHEYQATDVSGIKGGALMCETRRNSRMTQPAEGDVSTPAPVLSQGQRRYRVPRDSTPRAPREDSDYTEVRRKTHTKPAARKPATKNA